MNLEKRPEGARRSGLKLHQHNHATDLIGACPVCGENDGLVHVRAHSYGLCHEHNCYWQVPDGFFHGGWLQDERDWALAAKLLASYSKVSPCGKQPGAA